MDSESDMKNVSERVIKMSNGSNANRIKWRFEIYTTIIRVVWLIIVLTNGLLIYLNDNVYGK